VDVVFEGFGASNHDHPQTIARQLRRKDKPGAANNWLTYLSVFIWALEETPPLMRSTCDGADVLSGLPQAGPP
jgi:hypothetical protein